jgi:hypothetical protein
MEHLFYLIVKGLSAVYILYRTFRVIFEKQGKNLWHFLTPKVREKKEPVVLQATPEQPPYSIVGKSQTVYLEEPPPPKKIEPVFSEDLQRVPAYEEEPDVTSDDVDYNRGEEVLTEEERFTPLDVEPDSGAESTGMTFEQISRALDVVQGKKTDDADRTAVARILYEVQGGDVFDFLASQAENETIIERLLKENLDDAGEILPENRRKRRREIEEFDMEKYV